MLRESGRAGSRLVFGIAETGVELENRRRAVFRIIKPA